MAKTTKTSTKAATRKVAAKAPARKGTRSLSTAEAARKLAKAAAPVKITVRYSSLDGVSKSRTFKTIEGARKYAQGWVGEFPEIGTGYAIAGDGVGKVTVSGAKLAELFSVDAAPAAKAPKVEVPVLAETKAPTGAKATILTMIEKSGDKGVSAAEIAKKLGWPRAGGTISRAIKLAPFSVAKDRDGEGVLRYKRA